MILRILKEILHNAFGNEDEEFPDTDIALALLLVQGVCIVVGLLVIGVVVLLL